MKKEIEVEIPSIPYYIKVGNDSVSISDFSEEELKEIGELWTQKLIDKAEMIRKTPNY